MKKESLEIRIQGIPEKEVKIHIFPYDSKTKLENKVFVTDAETLYRTLITSIPWGTWEIFLLKIIEKPYADFMEDLDPPLKEIIKKIKLSVLLKMINGKEYSLERELLRRRKR